jgi:formylmethanofuran dehydrogenase subunit B
MSDQEYRGTEYGGTEYTPITVDFIKRESDNAILIVYADDDYWIPMSQVERIDRTVPPVLWIAAWLCKKEGFI